jgi:hypothetical protein
VAVIVVDCMPFIRGRPPRRGDILVDFVKRTFTNLLGKLPKEATLSLSLRCMLHVVSLCCSRPL